MAVRQAYCDSSIYSYVGMAWTPIDVPIFVFYWERYGIVLNRINCMMSESSKMWCEIAHMFLFVVGAASLCNKQDIKWITKVFLGTGLAEGSFLSCNTVHCRYSSYHVYGQSIEDGACDMFNVLWWEQCRQIADNTEKLGLYQKSGIIKLFYMGPHTKRVAQIEIPYICTALDIASKYNKSIIAVWWFILCKGISKKL